MKTRSDIRASVRTISGNRSLVPANGLDRCRDKTVRPTGHARSLVSPPSVVQETLELSEMFWHERSYHFKCVMEALDSGSWVCGYSLRLRAAVLACEEILSK